MSETSPSALDQARTLLDALRAETDPDQQRASFERLAEALDQAALAHKAAVESAETLRAEIAAFKDENAKLNSVMVHEIRKPMTSIRGYTDMLAKPGMIGPLNPMQQQFVDTIRANIIAMEGLVSNISDLNKLRSGKLQLAAKMTTFGQIMIEVQKQTATLATQFEHTATFEVPQGLPILTVDTPQVVKVIMHLARNACMYTPKGGQITISAALTDEPGIFRVTIRDTGVGMKPEEVARLGEPFYRADHELVTSQKGYGLGVPVAMGLLALMESRLDVESTPEQGSAFSFVLRGMVMS